MTAAYTPYNNRKNFPLHREKRELLRAATDVETLDKVYAGQISGYEYQIKKATARQSKWTKKGEKGKKGNEYVDELRARKDQITKLYNRVRRPLIGIIESRNRVFQDTTPEERLERTQAILRIPPAEFAKFDTLTPDEQDARLLDLVNQFGAGSKNGGFSPTLLNQPGLINSHTINSQTETDGTKRRSLLQWQMIDRLIYASMHPDRYQPIFFHKTDEVVERWGKKIRQMRSEGRFAMVKVLIVLILRMDIKKSMRSGIFNPSNQMFLGLSRQALADETGLSVFSVKQALENLVKLNILYPGKQPRELYQDQAKDEDPRYKGLPVVRKFSQLLIHALSLDDLYRATRAVDPTAGFSPEQVQQLKVLELEGAQLGVDVSADLARLEVIFFCQNTKG